MKKYIKYIVIALISIIVLCLVGYFGYKFFVDKDSLTVKEKKWIDANGNNVVSIAVPNDVPVFGKTGEGVFFDFTNYLSENVGLNINNNTVSYTSTNTGYRFEITKEFSNDGLLLYTDHYVLVSTSTGLVNNMDLVSQYNAGVIASDIDYLASYYKIDKTKFKSYDSYSAISTDLANGNLSFAIVPLNEYKEELISNNVNVLYHISDLKKYYYFKLGDDSTINSIIKKKFDAWYKSSYKDSYNTNNYELFVNKLGLTEVDEDSLNNKVYKYGFAEIRPYEVLASGTYGGITAEYLKGFSDFSGVEFTYKKFKSSKEVQEAAVKGNINLYYNYYDLLTNNIDAGGLQSVKYYVIADNSIDLDLSDINGLAYSNVYVQANTYLYDLIKDLNGIKITTYEKTSELKSIIHKKSIVLVDEYTYDYYINDLTDSYSVRLKGIVDDKTYAFRYENNTDVFYKLFYAYNKTIDPASLVRSGVESYNKVVSKGSVVTTIAIIILACLGLGLIILIFYKRNTRSLKINTKVKKEDKVKYIDLLTSLKNRNYYNDKLIVWNKNTIYPQTCIVMDINGIKELNDSFGHEEGDKQILAVANILIKTQVDNSEIIRTDGNEFFVYLVGYSEKQVLSYIKKINKEFKTLPYSSGVAVGFSMIEDSTKLVEDAFNEASIQMRENKEIYEKDKKEQ